MRTADENALWKWCYKQLKTMDDVDWQRIENGVGSGTPDVNLLYHYVEFWWELKVSEERKRKGTTHVKFRPLQIPWMSRRIKRGGRAFVLVQHYRERFLIPGNLAHLVDGTFETDRLRDLSCVDVNASLRDMLEASVGYWFDT